MKLGIDFGTTRIVVARADRGNYPIVQFEDPDGGIHDYIPALVAASNNEIRYGWDAWAVSGEPNWTLTRSVKRVLDTAGPGTQVDLGPIQMPLLDVLTGMALAIRRCLGSSETVEAMIGVPANSNSNQRYLTAEAFRLGGFHVLGLLNEPSAAGVEYGHAAAKKGSDERLLLIYDLGGGTFDASVVEMRGGEHEVLASEGIGTLGGDDFDSLLADMALSSEALNGLSQSEHFRLQEHCRELKESLHPNSRKITFDLDFVRTGLGTLSVPVVDYFEKCKPLVEETLNAVDDLLAMTDAQSLDCLYVTGGGSELPLVPRMLRERFGRRVKRSAYTRAATAIGLAIHADGQAGFALREKFTRYFGVWREAEGGREIVFDPVFTKGTALPKPGELPLKRERIYRPAHNVGHFRYLEASAIDSDGRPAGDITLWDEILFPFDPSTEKTQDLKAVPVTHSPDALNQEIAEVWVCDSNGSVEVQLANRTSGFEKRFRLGRWSSATASIAPAKVKRRRAKA